MVNNPPQVQDPNAPLVIQLKSQNNGTTIHLDDNFWEFLRGTLEDQSEVSLLHGHAGALEAIGHFSGKRSLADHFSKRYQGHHKCKLCWTYFPIHVIASCPSCGASRP